jgi:hypothetical protein
MHAVETFSVNKCDKLKLCVLPYKSEGRGFDPRCCHWIFSLTYSFWPHFGSGVDLAFSRNEYQEYCWGVKEAGA